MRGKLPSIFATAVLATLACSSSNPVTTDVSFADAPASEVRDGDIVFPDTGLTKPDVVDLLTADVPDVADTQQLQCDPGEGCFLDKCSDNKTCQSGWCVQHMGEGVCSQTCQEECPTGWSCQQVAGTDPDVVYICVSSYANLCRPCSTNDNCKSVGGAEDACIDYGPDGNFCGGPCGDAGECPWGFSCKDVTTVEGSSLQQCVNDTGECPCTDSSVALGLTTPCEVANELGTCTGKRTCTEDSLTDCDAATPAEESCNGLDDDCDGEVNEPALVDGDYVNLCNDDNDCTDDKCTGEEGCVNEVLVTGDCSDENPCTVADHCVEGTCMGDQVECDDGNPCTDNVCTETGGCEYPANSAPCDDDNPCTLADQCNDGTCTGTPVDCDCLADEDCLELEDGDQCNGTLACDTETLPYKCVVDPATVVTCPDPEGENSFCLQANCDPGTGACSFAPNHEGFLCDNANACTVNDKCVDGECAGGKEVNCNDGNPCTDDSCDGEVGCIHANNGAPCDDGQLCSKGDTCSAGTCTGGQEVDCNDGNDCTADNCDNQLGCIHELLDGGQCNDGNLCTETDSCHDGVCVGTDEVNCNDDNPCTDNICNPATGCVSVLNEAPCNDDDVCSTDDHCHLGDCVGGGQLGCSDGNPCTSDSCSPGIGCQFFPVDIECNDGSKCTVGDHCAGGWCVSGPILDCDDNNSCTEDACEPELGCTYAHTLNGDPCDEDKPLAACDAGVCVCAPDCAGNQCGSDGCGGECGQCDEATCCFAGACQFPPIHVWSTSMKGTGHDQVKSISPTDDGSVYIAGHYEGGTLDVGGGPLDNLGKHDVFLARLNASGKHVWSQRFGGIDEDFRKYLQATPDGGVILAACFSSPEFGFGGKVFESAGEEDCGLAKFDKNGVHEWSIQIGGSNYDWVQHFDVDPDGSVVICGTFNSPDLDFGDGPLETFGETDIFVAVFDGTGQPVWSSSYGGDGDEGGTGARFGPDGDIIVSGYFKSDQIGFGPEAVVNSGGSDIFVAKFSGDGNVQWVNDFEGAGDDNTNNSAIDSVGNILLAGRFRDSSLDAGGGPLPNLGGFDAFIAKLSPDGEHLWSKRFGGSADDYGYRVDTDSEGNCYFGGVFTSPEINLGGGPLLSGGGADLYLAKMNPDGNHVWSRRYGAEGQDELYALAVGSDHTVYIAGRFSSQKLELGGAPLVNTGGFDAYAGAFFQCPTPACIPSCVDQQCGNDGCGGNCGDCGGAQDACIAGACIEALSCIWSHSFNSNNGSESVDDISHADNGNIWLVGEFQGTEFSVGGDTFEKHANVGQNDVFIAAFSHDGEHVMSENFGSTGGTHTTALAMAKGSSPLVVGSYSKGGLDFGGGPLPYGSISDSFLASFTPSGQFGWTTVTEGGDVVVIQAIDVANSDDIIVAGKFGGDDLTIGQITVASKMSGSDMFISRLDDTGSPVWLKTIGGNGNVGGVAVDANESVFVSGSFYGPWLDFDGEQVASKSGHDLFLAKMTADGAHSWTLSSAGAANWTLAPLAIDGDDSVLFGGTSKGQVSLGQLSVPGHGGEDWLVAKVDASGETVFLHTLGGATSDYLYSVKVDGEGYVYLAGTTTSKVFNTLGGTVLRQGYQDALVVKLSPNGDEIFAKNFGWSNAEFGSISSVTAMALDDNANLLLGGSYSGAGFDLGCGPFDIEKPAGVFLSKLAVQ